MSSYLKPQALLNEEMAEGIFAASGTQVSGTGVNITWTVLSDGMHETTSHPEDPHPIRKFSYEIPAMYYGQLLHFSIDARGPIRHGGFHHQIESTVTRTATHVEGDFKVSATNQKYFYLCVDTENAPDGFEIISVSVVPK